MCSLFGTGDYCGLDCCTNAHSLGRTGKTLNEGNKCLFFQHGKSCLMLGSFSNRKWQRDSFQLVAIGFLEACHTAASKLKLFPTQGLRCLPSSSFLKIAKETLFIDLTLCEMETVERMALSQWSLLDTCMCALCSVLVITVDWIAERMLIQWARLARH